MIGMPSQPSTGCVGSRRGGHRLAALGTCMRMLPPPASTPNPFLTPSQQASKGHLQVEAPGLLPQAQELGTGQGRPGNQNTVQEASVIPKGLALGGGVKFTSPSSLLLLWSMHPSSLPSAAWLLPMCCQTSWTTPRSELWRLRWQLPGVGVRDHSDSKG